MSRSWATGSTRRWRKTRQHVLDHNLRTNGGRCTLAIRGICTGYAEDVHHIEGRAVTGDDPRHLAAACKTCNGHIGDPQTHPASCYCGWGRDGGPEPRPVSRW